MVVSMKLGRRTSSWLTTVSAAALVTAVGAPIEAAGSEETQPAVIVRDGSDLVITGTDASEIISVWEEEGQASSWTFEHSLLVGGAGSWDFSGAPGCEPGAEQGWISCDGTGVSRILIDLGGVDSPDSQGNQANVFTPLTSSPLVEVVGGPGADGFYAPDYPGPAIFRGAGGADQVRGSAGPDVILGGAGDDWLIGRGGADEMRGGPGSDELWGDEHFMSGFEVVPGADRVIGGPGDDRLHGQIRDDFVAGRAGNDLVYGGVGDDTLRGGSGDDRLLGKEADDSVTGGSGIDILRGAEGNDYLNGLDTNADDVGCGLDDDAYRSDRRDTVRHCETRAP